MKNQGSERRIVTRWLKGKTIQSRRVRGSCGGFLKFYGIRPREDLPLHLLFQNTLKYRASSSQRLRYPTHSFSVSAPEQIEEIMNPVVPTTLQIILRNLSDQTKMQILKAISDEPKY
jgi:hypothetical protein